MFTVKLAIFYLLYFIIIYYLLILREKHANSQVGDPQLTPTQNGLPDTHSDLSVAQYKHRTFYLGTMQPLGLNIKLKSFR